MGTKTIVFIHGLFMSSQCWDSWVDYYRTRGYQCLAIPWPGRDRPLEQLKQQPDLALLSRLSFADVLNHYSEHLKQFSEKPIMIGHSLGGLFTQLLLQQDLAAAGIAIDSAPPAGLISTKWSFLRSNWPSINLLIPDSRVCTMSFKDFQYAFVNGLPLDVQRKAYEQVVPESRRAWRGVLKGGVARIDFTKPHAPLLLIAGTNDHIIPASLNQANYRRYSHPSSVTDFKEFAGRTHYLIGQEGWQEIASYIIDWLEAKKI
jgi:pimeloyl-ACP methyl ester carboxylesterase